MFEPEEDEGEAWMETKTANSAKSTIGPWVTLTRKTSENVFKNRDWNPGEEIASLKFIARNTGSVWDAKSAISRLERLCDFEAISSIAGSARLDISSVLALKALERNGKGEMIINAIFNSRNPTVVARGVMMLVESGTVEELQEAGMLHGYGRDMFKPIASALARVIDIIVANEDNVQELLKIASSRLSYLQAKDAKDCREEAEGVNAAIHDRDKAALVVIALRVKEEFLALSGNGQAQK